MGVMRGRGKVGTDVLYEHPYHFGMFKAGGSIMTAVILLGSIG